MSSIQDLRNDLKEDEKWLKYRSILKQARTINLDDIYREVENTHKGRKMRVLLVKNPSPDLIMDAILQDASYRSRLVEIINETQYRSRLLSTALDVLHNYILGRYGSLLSQFCKTKGDRDGTVSSLLTSGHERMSEFNTISELCQNVIDDIDKASWQIKTLVQLLDIKTQRSALIGTI